ncbi:ligase-associated DNA damage response endonuclease PdeM [Paracoccus aminophilus]|uniref:Metallo-phosphoesterase n=1 Tax=Paracoccus aminophilus JCM 7686 TaxID=1367847 RepID=S5Y5T3_PARAH|nr:ligase-associated DNA damage response endonuclease PdeM [Paracoccus aminophilus]AGT11050.1 metallo-phosphoesterase [Paracoccus aminophilus JCM 7686]
MSGLGFAFHGVEFEARVSGALWWPRERWLIVADLHFGKSERMARRGGALLPPFENRATLERLGAEIAALAPRRIISLGDGFDDLAAAEAFAPRLGPDLAALAKGCDWLWISGNHDPGPLPATLPGAVRPELALDGLVLRHEIGQGPDVSGHYHPAIRLGGLRRRAFLLGADHLILPAFGAYTGGMLAEEPPLGTLLPEGLALACCETRVLPLPFGARRR